MLRVEAVGVADCEGRSVLKDLHFCKPPPEVAHEYVQENRIGDVSSKQFLVRVSRIGGHQGGNLGVAVPETLYLIHVVEAHLVVVGFSDCLETNLHPGAFHLQDIISGRTSVRAYVESAVTAGGPEGPSGWRHGIFQHLGSGIGEPFCGMVDEVSDVPVAAEYADVVKV